MPLAGIHGEAGDSSSTPGLLKREARKSQQGAQQTPRACVRGLEEGAWRADLRWALAMLASVVQSLVVNELKLLSGGMSVGLTPFSSLWASDSQWG